MAYIHLISKLTRDLVKYIISYLPNKCNTEVIARQQLMINWYICDIVPVVISKQNWARVLRKVQPFRLLYLLNTNNIDILFNA